MEAQIHASGLRDRELAQEIGTAVQDQTRLLGEQLQLMYERMALETSSVNDSVTHLAARNEERARGVGEYLDLLSDRVGVSARDSVAEIRRVFEGRVLGLAQLVRSDSEVLRNAIVRTADAHDDSVARAVDERLASLARLIRSDNETIAQQIVADQESSKQALRAMKELQASLPGEVIEMVEQRFASLAESIERSNEMLAKRIDRMAQTIGDRHDTDIQVVIDRMGDAMHALASLGRGPVARTPEPRIELE
jgi:hypothetical protein